MNTPRAMAAALVGILLFSLILAPLPALASEEEEDDQDRELDSSITRISK
jgi:hypothetical protein